MELYRRPEKGFLGGTFAFTLNGPLTVQYWRSFEDLERFARNPNDPHPPAWRRFNQKAKQRINRSVDAVAPSRLTA